MNELDFNIFGGDPSKSLSEQLTDFVKEVENMNLQQLKVFQDKCVADMERVAKIMQ